MSEKRSAIFILLVLLIGFSVTLVAQAPRPPADKLSLLRDVAIASPADNDVLKFDLASGKWINAAVPNSSLSLLDDVSLSSPTDGDALHFSGGGFWVNRHTTFDDLSGNIAITQMADGLGASDTTFWRGDGTWAEVPVGGGGGGAIESTDSILKGDGSGNASATQLTESSPGDFSIVQSTDGDVGLSIANANAGTSTRSMLDLVAGSTGHGGLEVVGAGPLRIYSDGTAKIDATATLFMLSGVEKARVVNGLTVGTTTDPGAGVINALTGYRINNAGTSGKVLQGNGTNYVASTPAWPTTAGTSGKIIQSNGTNFVASTPTWPTTAGATGHIVISNGTNFVTSTPTYPNAAGTSGQVITSDGTNFVLTTPGTPTTVSAARVRNSNDEAILNNTPAAITFDTEVRDDNAIHSTSSNTSRLTAPATGWYVISGNVTFETNNTGHRSVRIRSGGSTYLADTDVQAVGSTGETKIAVTTLVYLTASTYVELVVYQNSGSTINVMAYADYSPEFQMVRLN